MPTLSNSEAAALVRLMLDKLEELKAQDVIAGIDESLRLGIEEPVEEPSGRERLLAKGELKQVGTVRRRPPTDLERLRIVLEQLHQRLIIVPAIAQALQERLDTTALAWRVDSEFMSSDRSAWREASINDLLPRSANDVAIAYERVREMIPGLAPKNTTSHG